MGGRLAEAESLATALGDPHRLCWTLVYRCSYLWYTGRSTEARELGERVLAEAARLGEPRLLAAAGYRCGVARLLTGDYRSAETCLEEVLRACEGPLKHEGLGIEPVPAVSSQPWLVKVKAELGAFAEGVRLGEEAVRAAEDLDDRLGLLRALDTLGDLYAEAGDLTRAIGHWERFVDLSRRWDQSAFHARARGALGYARARAGQIEEGRALLTEALDEFAVLGLGLRRVQMIVRLGETALLAGDLAERPGTGSVAWPSPASRESAAMRPMRSFSSATSRRGASLWTRTEPRATSSRPEP
ncbi:MAG: tetratricopeptide repeat protein, partial [Candidatus Rokuibacteriota bacterium]